MPHHVDENDDEQQLISAEQQPAVDNNIPTAYAPTTNSTGIFYADESNFVPAAQLHNSDISPMNFDNVNLGANQQVLVSDAPPDHLNYTYFVFYLLGVGTMTPWNFFITAEDYWNYKFRNTSLNDTDPAADVLTPLQKSFSSDLTLTAALAGTTFLVLNAIYGHHISLRIKIVGTLTIILILFGVTIGFVEVNTDTWQEQFFVITLFSVVLLNICSATMSGGVFGFTGLFPAEYMTAVVSGQALGGILTALAFIVVLAIGATPQVTAFIFFIIGAILIFFSIICYIVMASKPFFKYYLEGGDKYKILCETPSHNRIVDTGVPLEPILKEVISKIYIETITICLLYITTLSVYPSITVLMRSEDYHSGNTWSNVYFLPVVNYVLFNCGDYFGRLLAGWLQRPYNNVHTALLLTVSRILFLPLILCSNTEAHNFLPTLVHSDWEFITIMAGFSLSNGYLTNILLMMAPRSVQQHEKELASSIMAASLSCGLALGAILSAAFVQML